METEMISALDDIEPSLDERLIPTTAFAPPALSDSQYKQLELLQHLSLYSELVIFLSGDHGMGKSFIAQALLASREAPDQSLLLEADFSLSYFDILHKLAEFFDLAEPTADLQGFENQVVSHCQQLADDDQGSMLLIIDKADQLSDDTLEDLNNLALLVPNALHLMLLAVPSFEEKLVSLTEPLAPLHVMELEALQDEEAEILLLQVYPDKEWSGEELNYILQQSVGNPGKLLYIAQQLIAGNKPQSQANSGSKFPITHIAAMLLIACALVMSYLYQSGPEQAETESQAQGEVADTLLVDHKPVMSGSEKNEVTLSDNESLYSSEEKTSQDTVLAADTVEEVDFNFIGTEQQGEEKPDSAVEVVTAKADVELGANTQITTEAQIQQESDARTKAELKREESHLVLDAKSGAVAEPVIEKHYSAEDELLLAAEDGSYIIQLFGSYSEKNANTFVKTYNSKSTPLIIYQTLYQSKPWHVVIAGPYRNRALAEGQLKYFPQKIRQQNPWVRSISAVKDAIKAAK